MKRKKNTGKTLADNLAKENDNEGMDKASERSNQPLYKAPDFESEEIFERRALACGKCHTGPHMQHGCFRLPSVS